VVVYVVWGSTYLAIRVLDRYLPPMLAMGTRFTVAGALLAVVLAARHGPAALRVPPRRALAAATVGVLLLLCGNGAVAVAEQTVPSGLAALLVSAVPLWLVCLRLVTRDAPRPATIAGTVLGFAGIAVLVLPGNHPAGTALWGVLTIMVGAFCWSVGSFVSPLLPLPDQPFVTATYEMGAAGLVMLAVGAVAGEGGKLRLASVPAEGWLALAYLIVIGSLVAFSAYAWLLGRAPLSLTGTYAYVNPVVAVILGAALLSEPLTWPILVGGAIVVAGVGLVVSVERPGGTRPPAPGGEPAEAGGPPAPDSDPAGPGGRAAPGGDPAGEGGQVPGGEPAGAGRIRRP
jgi:drug/metabolite transporter (DMT)-like permease